MKSRAEIVAEHTSSEFEERSHEMCCLEVRKAAALTCYPTDSDDRMEGPNDAPTALERDPVQALRLILDVRDAAPDWDRVWNEYLRRRAGWMRSKPDPELQAPDDSDDEAYEERAERTLAVYRLRVAMELHRSLLALEGRGADEPNLADGRPFYDCVSDLDAGSATGAAKEWIRTYGDEWTTADDVRSLAFAIDAFEAARALAGQAGSVGAESAAVHPLQREMESKRLARAERYDLAYRQLYRRVLDYRAFEEIRQACAAHGSEDARYCAIERYDRLQAADGSEVAYLRSFSDAYHGVHVVLARIKHEVADVDEFDVRDDRWRRVLLRFAELRSTAFEMHRAAQLVELRCKSLRTNFLVPRGDVATFSVACTEVDELCGELAKAANDFNRLRDVSTASQAEIRLADAIGDDMLARALSDVYKLMTVALKRESLEFAREFVLLLRDRAREARSVFTRFDYRGRDLYAPSEMHVPGMRRPVFVRMVEQRALSVRRPVGHFAANETDETALDEFREAAREMRAMRREFRARNVPFMRYGLRETGRATQHACDKMRWWFLVKFCNACRRVHVEHDRANPADLLLDEAERAAYDPPAAEQDDEEEQEQ